MITVTCANERLGRPDLADAQTLAAARAAMQQAMTGVSEEGRVSV